MMHITVREALKLGHNYIGTEHLLLSVLEFEEASGGGPLTGLGITRERAQQWLGAELQRLAEAKRQAASG
jgi:hypothetical protein